MLVALSDTHSTTDLQLTPHLRELLGEAELLVHAGDFITETVFDGFEELAPGLAAVHGNSDTRLLCDRLPDYTTAEWAGRRVLVTHGHRHDATSLSLLARQESADLVVTGHTHRPKIGSLGGVVHVNPGSHAQPRGNRAAFGVFQRENGGVSIELRAPNGAVIERESI